MARQRNPFSERGHYFSFLLLLHVTHITQAQELCTVCRDGSAIPLPDKAIQIEGIPFDSCSSLDLAASFLPIESDLCVGIRNVGTLCGCPIPENACTLCQDGSTAGNPAVTLPDYFAQEFISVAPPEVSLTCETLQAVLHSIDADEPRCMEAQLDVDARCACPSSTKMNETLSPSPSLVFTPTQAPFPTLVLPPTPAPLPTRQSCPICAHGGTITKPDRDISLGKSLPVDKCSDLSAFAGLLTGGTLECMGLQTLGPYCGCPVPQDACTFCPNGEPVPLPDQRLDWFDDFLVNVGDPFRSIGDELTCSLLESIATKPPQQLTGFNPDFACLSVQLKSYICGCSPDYRQILLTWAFRGSSMLSFLCSSLIIWDVYRRTKKSVTIYHQLVLGISLFDCIGSFGYMMVGVFAPREAGFYMSLGNDDTCLAQAFLIQFGQTSVFYNLFLSVYFYLVICANWKEFHFKKFRWWIHVLVLCLGLVISIVATLFYSGPQFGVCSSVVTPPIASSYWPVSIFNTIPISTALLVLMATTILICVRVYSQQKKSRRWTLSRNLRLTKRVFWQSFWYVMAFYTTLPFLMVSYYVQYTSADMSFWILVVVALVAPAQGLTNALVYFQRSNKGNIFCCLQSCCKKKKEAHPKGVSGVTVVRESTESTHLPSSTKAQQRHQEEEALPPAQDNDVPDRVEEPQVEIHKKPDTRKSVTWLDDDPAAASDGEEIFGHIPDIEVDGQGDLGEMEEAARQTVTKNKFHDSLAALENQFSAVAEFWVLNEDDEDDDEDDGMMGRFLQDDRGDDDDSIPPPPPPPPPPSPSRSRSWLRSPVSRV